MYVKIRLRLRAFIWRRQQVTCSQGRPYGPQAPLNISCYQFSDPWKMNGLVGCARPGNEPESSDSWYMELEARGLIHSATLTDIRLYSEILSVNSANKIVKQLHQKIVANSLAVSIVTTVNILDFNVTIGLEQHMTANRLLASLMRKWMSAKRYAPANAEADTRLGTLAVSLKKLQKVIVYTKGNINWWIKY